MNIFDALNIFYREDVISDFLCNCFNDSDEFLVGFLNEAGISIEYNSIECVSVKTRISLGKGIGTPDIIIKLKIKNKYKVVIIENKLGAGEGYHQTLRYGSNEAYYAIAQNFNLESYDLHTVFLTLDSTVIPRNKKFISVSYEIFRDNEWHINDDNLAKIFEDFKEKLQDFYKPIINPFLSLSENIVLDGIQKSMVWLNVIDHQFNNYDKQNFIHEYGRVVGRGREKFLYLLTKDIWRSNFTYEENLEKSFFIHIDTGVDLINKETTLLNSIEVRYETNPYTPHKRLENLNGYADFLMQKKTFAENLYKELDKERISYNKSYRKLLVAKINLDQTSLDANLQSYYDTVKILETAIDSATHIVR